MSCFHEISLLIGECNSDASIEYEQNYIQPLVEQTRGTIIAHCKLAPPYDQYFISAASSIDSTQNYRRLFVWIIVLRHIACFVENVRTNLLAFILMCRL